MVVRMSDIELLDHYLEQAFPETFSDFGTSKALKERSRMASAFVSDSPAFSESVGYLHRKKRGEDIAGMVSVLHDGESDTEHFDPATYLDSCFSALRGKSVLSIGDDTGSLTEVLKRFGVKVTGIEYDPELVAVAHTGLLAEDYSPQEQVLQGDAWELPLPSSRLCQQLGSYDLLFTNNLFDIGSGGEAPSTALESQIAVMHELAAAQRFSHHFDTMSFAGTEGERKMWFQLFMVGVEHLLVPGGKQLHLNTEFSYSVGAAQLSIEAYDPASGRTLQNTFNHVLRRQLYKSPFSPPGC